MKIYHFSENPEKVILTSGVMLLYISSAYAAQIQYEFYYDAQIPAIVGSEVNPSIK